MYLFCISTEHTKWHTYILCTKPSHLWHEILNMLNMDYMCIKTMTVGVLAPYVARSSAAMILILQGNNVAALLCFQGM